MHHGYAHGASNSWSRYMVPLTTGVIAGDRDMAVRFRHIVGILLNMVQWQAGVACVMCPTVGWSVSWLIVVRTSHTRELLIPIKPTHVYTVFAEEY